MDITKLTQALSLSLSNNDQERKANADIILQVNQIKFCFHLFILNHYYIEF